MVRRSSWAEVKGRSQEHDRAKDKVCTNNMLFPIVAQTAPWGTSWFEQLVWANPLATGFRHSASMGGTSCSANPLVIVGCCSNQLTSSDVEVLAALGPESLGSRPLDPYKWLAYALKHEGCYAL